MRLCRRRRRRARHDAGDSEKEVGDSRHHGEPGTVRGPERPQPVPGSTNAPAPSLGRSAQGVGNYNKQARRCDVDTLRGGSADQGRCGRQRTPPMEQKAAFCDLPGGRCDESSRNERITPAFCFSRGWARRRDTLVDGPAEVTMPGRAGMPPGGGFLSGAAGRPRGSGRAWTGMCVSRCRDRGVK